MVQLFGINFPEQRLVKMTLQRFYGIGSSVSQRIMAKYVIHPAAKLGSLSDHQLLNLNTELSSMKIENDLRRQVQGNIKRLRDLGTYRGRRHAMGLPVRGQRTRSQIKTAKQFNKVERER